MLLNRDKCSLPERTVFPSLRCAKMTELGQRGSEFAALSIRAPRQPSHMSRAMLTPEASSFLPSPAVEAALPLARR